MEHKLALIPKQTIFQVPEGYFDTLLARIENRLQTSHETEISATAPLESYSPITDLRQETVFEVPPQYFETLGDRIQEKVISQTQFVPLNFEALVDFETDRATKSPFTVPDNYFENLSEQIVAKIVSSENQKPEPLEFSALEEAELGILASIPKQTVFELPSDYFEKLSVEPEGQVKTLDSNPSEKEAKVIRFVPGWVTYAASIAAVALLFFTGYWFYSAPANVASNDCTDLLCNVSDEAILNYLEQDVRFSNTQLSNPSASQLDYNGLDQTELSEDELLNAAESIE